MAQAPQPDFAYDGFISYRHSQRQTAITRALQDALHGFARPMWKPRAVRLYRDETNLEANPNLWGTIVEALNQSRFFLLMASSEAAESRWVKRELEHWLGARGAAQLIIILTDGSVAWNGEAGAFDPSTTNAIPRDLLGAFETEPLYVDLSWVDDPDEQLVLSNPRFLDAVATIAAALHGKSKDEIAGADIKQLHRRRTLAAGAIATISIALAGAVVFALNFLEQRDQAREQRDLAASRQLATQAGLVLHQQPDLALLLAAGANKAHPTFEARDALARALQELNKLERFEHLDIAERTTVQIAEQGKALVWVDANARLLLKRLGSNGAAVVLGRVPCEASAVAINRHESAISVGCVDGRTLLHEPGAANDFREVIRVKEPGVASLAFSPDGALLAVGGGLNEVLVVDVATGDVVRRAAGHKAAPRALAFSGDGSLLTIPGEDGRVDILSFDDEESPTVRRTQLGFVHAVDFSPDGSMLAAGDDEGEIVLLSVADGQDDVDPVSIHAGIVRSLRFSPDGKRLAAGFDDGKVALIGTGILSREIETLNGHGRAVTTLAFSADGTYLFSGGWDRYVAVWDLANSVQAKRLSSPAAPNGPLAFSADGEVLIVGSGETIMMFPMTTDDKPLELTTSHGPVLAVQPREGKAKLATAHRDGALVFWDTDAGVVEREVWVPLPQPGADPNAHGQSLQPAEPSPRWFSAAGLSGQATPGAVVLTGGTPPAECELGRFPFRAATFSIDADIAALLDSVGCPFVWTEIAGWREEKLPHRAWSARRIALSPDGDALAVGGERGTLEWVRLDGSDLEDLPDLAETLDVQDLVFAPDASGIIVVGDRWVPEPDQGRLSFPERTGFARSMAQVPPASIRLEGVPAWASLRAVAFNANAGLVAVGGCLEASLLSCSPGMVALFDVATGQPIGPAISSGSRPADRIAFDPSGERLAVASSGSSVFGQPSMHEVVVFDLSNQSLRRTACAVANRQMTNLEVARYLEGLPELKPCTDRAG